jgi:hypothetical protein
MLRSALLAALCAVPATAAQADPAAWLPERAAAEVRVPDLERSRARWSATPYERLLLTGWGRTLVAEWGGRLEAIAPGGRAALETVRALAWAVDGGGGSPEAVAAIAGDAQALRTALHGFAPVPATDAPNTALGPWGRLTAGDGILAFATAPDGAVEPSGAALRPPEDREADAELRIDPERWVAMVGNGPVLSGPLTVSFTLDAVGLRERARAAPTPALSAAAAAATRWADPQELRSLPAETLWALTWTADRAAIAAWQAATPPSADFEAMLARLALPGWRATVAALDGPGVLWLAEGAPFPSAGIALGLDEAVARGWLAAAQARLGLAAGADGTLGGFLGLVPIAAGWVPGPGGGRLVVTTDPRGLAAWTARKPGFAEHPGVAETLAAVPERSLAIGASRGGQSWATLAQLSVPLFVAMGAPQAVSLPNDLRAASPRGWLHAQLLADGTVAWDAGGLFGGPVAALAATAAAVPATIWLHREQRRQAEAARQAEPQQQPAEPPVF